MTLNLKVLYIIIFLLSTAFQLVGQSGKEEKIDFTPDTNYDLIADRLNCIEGAIPLNFNNRVKSFVDYFTIRNRTYTEGIVAKKKLYFPIMEDILEKHGLPDELKYLSIVESGLNPNAISRVGAGGLWQFMPSTGKLYSLSQSWYIDERMNPEKSTIAACRYLKELHGMFGDWELALAAYNTGPGNVRRAIRRSGYKKTFWEIYRFLPRETRSYVPQFVAVMYALSYADEHGFFENEMEVQFPMESATIQVDDYFHLETFAQQLNLCVDDLLMLNPQIIRGAVPDGVKNYPVKVPLDLHDAIKAKLTFLKDTASKVGKKELTYLARNTPGSTYGRDRVIYKVRSGDVLGTIANKFHVRVSDIKKWNKISGTMIRVGQRLNIWALPYYKADTKSSYAVKNLPQKVQVKNGSYHLVRSGDSLWSISRQYEGLSITQLKTLNNLTTSRIKPGQKLRISK